MLSNVVAVLLLVALAVYAFARFSHSASEHASRHAALGSDAATRVTPRAAPAERPIDLGRDCDGRTQCTQMSSCTEAKYFLQNCPGVQLDSNRNGVPCEKTWCNTPLAR